MRIEVEESEIILRKEKKRDNMMKIEMNLSVLHCVFCNSPSKCFVR